MGNQPFFSQKNKTGNHSHADDCLEPSAKNREVSWFSVSRTQSGASLPDSFRFRLAQSHEDGSKKIQRVKKTEQLPSAILSEQIKPEGDGANKSGAHQPWLFHDLGGWVVVNLP
ncbi:hypothetical protein V6C31_07245 [Caldibacillus debilis]|uniref:hypothetical protein n=1 Tax=Caldibacillus debilis TaxID=301148 RepID=UPI002FD94B00